MEEANVHDKEMSEKGLTSTDVSREERAEETISIGGGRHYVEERLSTVLNKGSRYIYLSIFCFTSVSAFLHFSFSWRQTFSALLRIFISERRLKPLLVYIYLHRKDRLGNEVPN